MLASKYSQLCLDLLLYIERIYLVYVLLFISYCIVCILHSSSVPFSFSCHDNKNTYVYLQHMYITPWNEYVKLSHLTHQDFCEHNILPLLITSVINISIINLHFHYDYG